MTELTDTTDVERLQLKRETDLLTAVAPRIPGSRTSRELSVVQRRPVSMECNVSGVPPPAVTWSKDGERIFNGGRSRLLHGGRVLQVPAALLDDAGVYVCTAQNVAGVDRKQFRLQVFGT